MTAAVADVDTTTAHDGPVTDDQGSDRLGTWVLIALAVAAVLIVLFVLGGAILGTILGPA
jgi:hypothetical protein